MDETRGRSCAFISPRQTILEIRKAGGIHENEGKGKYRAGNYRKGKHRAGKHRAGKHGRVYTGGFIRKEEAQTALRLVKTLKNTRAADVQGECHRRPPKAGRQSGPSWTSS
jgi:hypothetical protein